MNLSPHFTVEELSVTTQVGPDGQRLWNTPVGVCLDYLRQLATTVLEPIRVVWGCPVIVTSGYRSPAVERAVQRRAGLIGDGDALAPSQHLWGQAADIVPGVHLDLDEAFQRIWESGIPYDQLLLEGSIRDGVDHRWIHVSCAPVQRAPRRQALASLDGRQFTPYTPPKEGTA